MSSFSEKAKAKHRRMSSLLKNARHDAGHTMRTLSQILGTPHSFIGKIENQDRRLDIAEFVIYSEGLGRDPVDLFRELISP